MDYKSILEQIQQEVRPFFWQGKVTNAIPELAAIDASKFGIHLLTTAGDSYSIGDSEEQFSIQSITKVFSVALALSYLGEETWNRVGVEPSGNAFNSLVQLEYERGKPRNPFINSGALVISDMLVSLLKNPEEEYLNYVRTLAGSNNIHYNYAVAQSEMKTSYRNAALTSLLKSFGNLENAVNRVLEFYTLQCAVEMSCSQLAQAFLFFAKGNSDQAIIRQLTHSQKKRLNALMQTCGFYDESGEFAYKVGLPGKSGIGGGIVAIHPGQYCVATWSPKLNEKGNSVLGMKSLELLTTKTGKSIF